MKWCFLITQNHRIISLKKKKKGIISFIIIIIILLNTTFIQIRSRLQDNLEQWVSQ